MEPPSPWDAFMKNVLMKNGCSRRASAFSISSFTAKRRSALMDSCASAFRSRMLRGCSLSRAFSTFWYRRARISG